MRSFAYCHFDTSQGGRDAICKHCGTSVKFNRDTTCLVKHLHRKHPELINHKSSSPVNVENEMKAFFNDQSAVATTSPLVTQDSEPETFYDAHSSVDGMKSALESSDPTAKYYYIVEQVLHHMKDIKIRLTRLESVQSKCDVSDTSDSDEETDVHEIQGRNKKIKMEEDEPCASHKKKIVTVNGFSFEDYPDDEEGEEMDEDVEEEGEEDEEEEIEDCDQLEWLQLLAKKPQRDQYNTVKYCNLKFITSLNKIIKHLMYGKNVRFSKEERAFFTKHRSFILEFLKEKDLKKKKQILLPKIKGGFLSLLIPTMVSVAGAVIPSLLESEEKDSESEEDSEEEEDTEEEAGSVEDDDEVSEMEDDSGDDPRQVNGFGQGSKVWNPRDGRPPKGWKASDGYLRTVKRPGEMPEIEHYIPKTDAEASICTYYLAPELYKGISPLGFQNSIFGRQR